MTDRLYFEDLPVGRTWNSARRVVEADEIVAFAEQFDPQPLHLGVGPAEPGRDRDLVASGWHTGSLAIRLLVDSGLGRVENFGSPGFNDLHWRVPVRPGDALAVRATVTESRRSRSKPDRGTYLLFVEVRNQRGETVMTFESIGIAKRRVPGDQPESLERSRRQTST